MELRFNEKKATQAAALFLKMAGGSLNYMVLIKDLYMMDREALARWAAPVTNDQFFSMKLGPVLSNVRNLIVDMPSPEEEAYWVRFISPPSDYAVHLLDDPGSAQLSEAEESLIAEIYTAYRDYQDKPFPFAKHLHSILAEWEPITSGRSPISIRAVLSAVGKSPEEINEIEDELREVSFAHFLLAAKS